MCHMYVPVQFLRQHSELALQGCISGLHNGITPPTSFLISFKSDGKSLAVGFANEFLVATMKIRRKMEDFTQTENKILEAIF